MTAVLVVAALVLLAGRAIGRIDDPPTLEEWARISCTAMSDPLTDESWETLRDRFAATLAGLDGAAPEGTAHFQSALFLGSRGVAIELGTMVRRDPGGNLETLLADLQRVSQTEQRGPTGDTVLAPLYNAISQRDALASEAAASLSPEARAALEAIPGCADRLSTGV